MVDFGLAAHLKHGGVLVEAYGTPGPVAVDVHVTCLINCKGVMLIE